MTSAELKAAIPAEALTTVALPQDAFQPVHSGKVRELFACEAGLLMIATDRLSAFDVILPTGVPGKGIVLTQMSRWWFEQTRDVVANHLVEPQDEALAEVLERFPHLIPRAMLVRPLERVPLECVVRGYLAGSGWAAYQKTGELWGRPLPPGLRESEALPEPVFTPTTKAAVGGKDEPLTPEEAAALAGEERARGLTNLSVELFQYGQQRASAAGLILADTKFEFGYGADGSLVLVDEIFTPDSSRYWPSDGHGPGRPQPAFDKQYVRDYLAGLAWNKQAPGPELPPEVVQQTMEKYLEAYQRLCGT
ncbi:MAG: phosphoribosylaminoimidazolesuccinocarboxamide synthase [Opitutales bacterium]